MNNIRFLLSAVLWSAASLSAFASVSVTPGGTGTIGTLTDLGSFAAGTYTITASGAIDLAGGDKFLIKADGSPLTSVTFPGYGYFNPSGSDIADGQYGTAGVGVKLGALIGSYTQSPTATDWFLIGTTKTLTLTNATHIYASVNDTFHQNNVGSFDVAVTSVPEPEAYGMLLSGLALIGGIARRRKMNQS